MGALKALEFLQQHGAEFSSVAEGFDTTTPAGKLMLNILLSFAEFERDRITESWDIATERAIKRGVHFTNSVPLGFQRENGNGLVPDPDTARVVVEMFGRRAQRDSWQAIARWMNETFPAKTGETGRA